MRPIYLFFLYILAAFAIDLVMVQSIHAQSIDPAASVQLAAVAAAPAPATPGQVVAPATASQPAVVAVEEPAAPPKWVADVIVSAQKLPIIGPIVSKVILYAGVLSSILTALFAAFFTILSALSGVLNLAGLQKIADAVQAFKKGKIMYYLAYLSMFNAKKPDQKPA